MGDARRASQTEDRQGHALGPGRDPRQARSDPCATRRGQSEGEQDMNNRRMQIVCATDLLPRSEAAVERAGILADDLAADLTLLHVVAPSESGRALEQALQHAQSRLRARARPPLWRA